MLSIVIADDEADIIALVKMLIEYPEAEVVGEAHNSRELFEKVEECRPNTVITDICMPGMTGLEFIEQAREKYPDINFIVMSGFAEFEYAQQAVRLGVVDYLLKPVSKVELNRILEKLDAQLKEYDLEESRHAGTEEELKNSMIILQQQYLQDVLKSKRTVAIPKVGERPVIELNGKMIQCILFNLDSRFAAKSVDVEMLMQKSEPVFSKTEEFEKIHKIKGIFIGADNTCINLAIYDAEAAEAKSRSLIDNVSEILRSFNYNNGFSKVSAAASEIIEGSVEGIAEALRQAEAAIKWRMEKTGSSVIRYKREDELALERISGISCTDELNESIAQKDIEKLEAVLKKIFDEYNDSVKTDGYGYSIVKETADCINSAFLALPGAAEIQNIMCLDMFNILAGEWKPHEISERILRAAESILKRYDEHFESKENAIIVRAKKYISDHFAEDITLNDLARHVCLNPSYLSTFFKNETGCGFSKYLKKIRVEEAKKSLKHTNMRIEDIAKTVGYRDVKSFNKAFLEETQVKPSAYRRFYAG